MREYIIARSSFLGATVQVMLCEKDDWEREDRVKVDVDGNEMVVTHEFEAVTWEDARAKRDKLMGWWKNG